MDFIDKTLDKIQNFSMSLYSLGAGISLAMINTGLGLTLIINFIEKIKTKDFSFKKNELFIAYSLFLIGVYSSFFDSVNLNNSFEYFKRYLYPFLAFYIVLSLNNISVNKIKKYINFIMISILLNMFYGYYQYIRGFQRIHGSMFVMGFASLLSFLIIFIFSYLINSNNKKLKRILLMLFLPIPVIALIFTGTRGVWVALVLSVLIILYIVKKRYIVYFLVFLLALLILIYFFLPGYYFDRFLSIFDLENNRSNLTRLYLWQGATLIFKDNIFNGIGLNNFQNIIIKSPYYNDSMVSTSHAHNNFFQLAAETGVLGLSLFIFLIYKTSKKLIFFVYNNYNTKLSFYYIASTGIFFSYIFHGLTEYNLEDRETSILVWVLIGLTIRLNELQSKNKENSVSD